MAGHSKWANIKHRKRVQDARRGKGFTRLIREITGSGVIVAAITPRAVTPAARTGDDAERMKEAPGRPGRFAAGAR